VDLFLDFGRLKFIKTELDGRRALPFQVFIDVCQTLEFIITQLIKLLEVDSLLLGSCSIEVFELQLILVVCEQLQIRTLLDIWRDMFRRVQRVLIFIVPLLQLPLGLQHISWRKIDAGLLAVN